jgi:SAM-dependent methyltransferase
MQQARQSGGSATRWGALFGERARDWAETWEGPKGYGTPLYEHVLNRAKIGSDSRVLDCGCGAGRFARMAADRGASVAGIDAAAGLVAIAAERTPSGDFCVGDLEALPWRDQSFDVVTGFNAFQFAAVPGRWERQARVRARAQVPALSQAGARQRYHRAPHPAPRRCSFRGLLQTAVVKA